MTTAYEIAKQGGKHKNFLRDYEKLPSHLIEKSIRSIRKQIAVHETWMADPAVKLRKVHCYSPERVEQYRVKGSKDIQRQHEHIDILRSIVEDRHG
ncbi:MAG: hypothetical protein U1F76_02775 [Candidatus Competibacteraceae bacterium]